MLLEQLQGEFIRALYSGQLAEADSMIQDNALLSAQQQFAIYHGSVTGTLVEALGDIFPRVKAALGERFFDGLARRYIREHPSSSASLDDYGSRFAEFCEDFEPLQSYPFIPDLVRVDWAWHRAFHCADVTAVDASCLQERLKEDPNLCFQLHPSAVFIESQFPIYQLWHFNERARADGSEEAFQLDQPKECMLVWRNDVRVETVAIDPLEQCVFSQFLQSQTLEGALENSVEKLSRVEGFQSGCETELLSQSISFLLARGLLIDASNRE